MVKINRAIQIIKKQGLCVFIKKLHRKINRFFFDYEQSAYKEWIKIYEENEMEQMEELEYKPLLSVVIPVYNVTTKQLTECIESVLAQTYKNWELCIADDASTWDNVKECLQQYEGRKRIKICYRQENGHISMATNSAIEMAEGEFIAFMDCDDTLAPHALYEVAKKLNEDKTLDFIYSDEDKIDDAGGNRHQPHFKPDWSPDTLMSHMYTCHLGVYRKSLGDAIGWLRKGYEGAQDYDFTLRFTEKTDKIAHIAKILYHWRERKESTSVNIGAKSYVCEAARMAKEDALKRRGLKGRCEWVEAFFQYRIVYEPVGIPLVSIIIPTKDNFEVFHKCVQSIRGKSSYKNYEIIVVDNGSSEEQKQAYERYCQEIGAVYDFEKMDFNFSAMCNRGAEIAHGELYLFLNDDTEVLSEAWIERMAGHAMLSHIGAVGAKLLYPDTSLIQHIGVANLQEEPVHLLGKMDDDITQYFGRNKVEYNYIAVTGACLMIEKKKFQEIKGFDESFAVSYNDIKLCFDLWKKGYYNVCRMDAVLYHYESLSRGLDVVDPVKEERLAKERSHLYEVHPALQGKDPFYSPNLSIRRTDCSPRNE